MYCDIYVIKDKCHMIIYIDLEKKNQMPTSFYDLKKSFNQE